jgi:hypothetical protein
MKNVGFCDVNLLTLVRTDVEEELIASIIRVKGISELGATLAISSSIVSC